MIERNIIRSEILTYLGHLPRKLQNKGTDAAGELALQVGNFLAWHAGRLDGPGAQMEQPLSQNPQSIWALGRQFQHIGRELIARPISQDQTDPFVSMTKDFDNLQIRLAFLENKIMGQGGAK